MKVRELIALLEADGWVRVEAGVNVCAIAYMASSIEDTNGNRSSPLRNPWTYLPAIVRLLRYRNRDMMEIFLFADSAGSLTLALGVEYSSDRLLSVDSQKNPIKPSPPM